MMKILDRYVFRTLCASLGVFIVVFTVLFLVVDCSSKLGKFMELKAVSPLAFILRYYWLRIPMSVTYLLPVSVLFAAVFTVTKLARANEVVPMLTAGWSFRRVAYPFWAAAFLAAGAIGVMEEFVLSGLGPEVVRSEEILSRLETSYGLVAYDGRMHLFVKAYDHVNRNMTDIKVVTLGAAAQPREIVLARRCRWDDARERFVAFDGTIERPGEVVFEDGGRPRTWKEPIGPEGFVLPAAFTPQEVGGGAGFVNLLPFASLKQLVKQARDYPDVPLLRVKLYSRLAFPFSPVILLLLGLPPVMVAAPKNFLWGLVRCLLLVLAYYGVHFLCLDLGNQGRLAPILAAWTPALLFGTAGFFALSRVKT